MKRIYLILSMLLLFGFANSQIIKPKIDAQTLDGYDSDSFLIPTITTVNAATYNLLATDYILNVVYTATGVVTITLPTAQTTEDRMVVIKDSDGTCGTNSITVQTEGAEKIDGEDTYVLDSNYDAISIYSDGSNWFVF